MTLLISAKTVTKLHNVIKLNDFMYSKLKNGLCKIVTDSQVVTKYNVTKSRLHWGLKSRVSEIRVKRIRFIQGVGVSKASKKGQSFSNILFFFGKHNFGHVLFKLKMPCFNNPKN